MWHLLLIRRLKRTKNLKTFREIIPEGRVETSTDREELSDRISGNESIRRQGILTMSSKRIK